MTQDPVKWYTIRRETGLVEHVCEHGVGHPNSGSIQYVDWYYNKFRPFMDGFYDRDESWNEETGLPYEPFELMPVHKPVENSSWGVHGCDGCCAAEDFPGGAVNAIKHALDRLNEHDPELLKKLRNEYFVLWWGLMAAVNEAVPE